MQTRDDQMIFEKYQQIDEVAIPFSGGKQFGIMNRFKKVLPGQWGKKAKAGINIEGDVNHFIELLNNLAHTTGESTADIIKSPKFSNWVKNTIKVDPNHIPNWSKLVQSGDVNTMINAAVIQRNKDHAYGVGHGAAEEPAAATTPEPTGDTSLPNTQAAPQTPAAQNTTTQTPAQSATQAAPQTPAAQNTTTQQSKGATVAQGRQAIDAAASALSKIRSRDRSKLVDYALDKIGAIDPKSKKSTNTAPSNVIQMPDQRNTSAAKAESVYINSNVVTEDIRFIDCSKF